MECSDYKECKGHNGMMLSHCGECSGCEHDMQRKTYKVHGIEATFKQCTKCGWTANFSR